MNKLTDCFTLSNGVKIPCLGYGTWQTPDGETARDCVKYALDTAGYRHVDTAFAYGNEVSVGEGIRASGVKREDIFLTTKHWVTERGYDKTIATAEASLKNLGTDYLDLYLIHWPAVAKISPEWKEINASTWRGFEKLYRDGKIRAIGVSNFLPCHLEALKEFAEIVPMVNQIEFHPGWLQKDCTDFCREKGIAVEAWAPLIKGEILTNGVIGNIAAAHGCSPAQVVLSWVLSQDIIPLCKSVTPSRIAENLKSGDLVLTAEEIASISAMSGCGGRCYNPDNCDF